ncbi:hypothetical protein C0992_000225 [Termitomyces sp. T32_za158]|nr:hypothetical protein C0992_000225 [Termitomyces sp. T32_za158]
MDMDTFPFLEHLPRFVPVPNIRFIPSFELQADERRSLADSTDRLWRRVSCQRQNIVRCSTLSADAVHVIETELNELEIERAKSKNSAVTSAGVVANGLKRSNQRPTSDQVSVLKTLLAQKNSELAKIESDLLRLQLKINDDIGALKELERLKTEKQAEANSCESWLVSARLLPLEVITRIFQYSIYYRGPSTTRRTSPFSLSQVCSTWRNSALGYSRFWNELELELFNVHKPNIGLLFDLWYGRANRYHPLSLSLKANVFTDKDVLLSLASHVTKFSPRMTAVSVEMSGGPESLAAFLVSPGGSFSNLESLTIIETEFTKEANPLPITVFDHSPRLRTVTLRVPRYMFEGDSRLFLPWTQLTHLHVGGPLLIQSFAIILFQCTQLQDASFHDINLADRSDTREPIIPPSPVEFPHLTDLRVRINGPFFSHDISDVLEMMLLPKVDNLNLTGSTFSFYSRNDDLFPVDFIVPPWNRFPPMRHLLLAYADISHHELLSALVASPLLESLTICLDHISPISLLKVLTRNSSNSESDSTPSLSNLTSFTFACVIFKHEVDEFDPDAFSEAFIAVITSWTTDSKRRRPLQKISLFVCHDDFHGSRIGRNEEVVEIFKKINETIQKNLVGLVDASIFTAKPIGDCDELLSIFGFEKRRIAGCSY